eukprot:9055741-Pyramimonas_sp.AAC.1
MPRDQQQFDSLITWAHESRSPNETFHVEAKQGNLLITSGMAIRNQLRPLHDWLRMVDRLLGRKTLGPGFGGRPTRYPLREPQP